MSIQKNFNLGTSLNNSMENCPDALFEFNNYQKFWNSILGVLAKGITFLFCFLTTILSVSSMKLLTPG